MNARLHHPEHLDLGHLEAQAAREEPSAQGATWISTQALADLQRRTLPRDPRTDQAMRSTLLGASQRLLRATQRGTRPLPHDALWNLAAFTLPALERILERPRGRIVRRHELLPTGRLKELDTQSMSWLSRQTGRTLREKVATTGKALGVTRRKSHDTQENRLAYAFLWRLWRQLESRHDHLDDYQMQGEALANQLRKLRHLARGLPHGPLAEAARPPQGSPNNALISDPDYGRVWRAWGWMRSWEEEALAIRGDLEGHLGPLLLLAMVSRLAQHPDVTLIDHPCREHDGQLQAFHGGQWGPLRRVSMVVRESPPADLHRGTVRMIHPEHRYGFLKDTQGRDHHFTARDLGDDLSWSQLKLGLEVLFSSYKDKRGWHAQDLALEARATLWELRLVPGGVEVYDAPMDETGLHQPALELVTRLEVALQTGQAPAQPRRGLALRLSNQQASLATYADQAGLAQVADWWHQMVLGAEVSPEAASDPNPTVMGLAVLHGAVDVSTPSRRGPLHSAGAHTWCFEDPSPQAEPLHLAGARRQIFTLDRQRGPSPCVPMLDPEHNHEPLRALSAHLRRELGQTPQTTLAYTVPDGVDEFSLRALRGQMGTLTPRALPVWRSVAAALEAEARHGDRFKVGQRALVLDLGQSCARLTPLRMRRHRDAPQGLWERRPALPEDEWSQALSLEQLLRDFLTRLLEQLLGGKPDDHQRDTFDALVDLCMALGVSYSLLHLGEPVFLPIETFWICLHPEDAPVREAWQGACAHWRETLRRALDDWSMPEQPLETWLRSGQGQVHLLLAGWIWGALPHPPKGAWLSVTASTSLSAGALEAARREHQRQTAWLEWVPELMMEVTRGGLYDEVCLLNGQSLEAHLGTEIRQQLGDPFVLPPDARELRFALAQGHPERHLLHRELRLRAPAFPLEREAEVQLTLRYRYGLEDSYTLQVEAVDPSAAGFQSVNTCWDEPRPPTDAHSQAPPFPEPPTMTQGRLQSEGQGFVQSFDWLQRALSSGSWRQDRMHRLCNDLRNKVYRVCRQDRGWAAHLSQHSVIPLLLARAQSGDGDALQRMSLVVLASLGSYAPAVIWPLIQEALSPRGHRSVSSTHAMEALGRMMQVEPGDQEQEACFWSVAREPSLATRSASLYNRTICTLAELSWRDASFLPRAYQEHPGFLEPLLRGLEWSVRGLLRSALKNSDLSHMERPWFLAWPLGCGAEAALALMQLRAVAPQEPALRAGDPRLRRLARMMRLLDGVMTRAGDGAASEEQRRSFRPRFSLKLETRPPEALKRVSPVIYAASAFLTGEQDTAMIQIREVTDV